MWWCCRCWWYCVGGGNDEGGDGDDGVCEDGSGGEGDVVVGLVMGVADGRDGGGCGFGGSVKVKVAESCLTLCDPMD